MKPQDRLTLTDQERESPLWKRLRAHYEKRLTSLRSQNDDPSSEHDTARRRGRIHEVKTLLSLNDAIQLPSRQE
jgi:hypothetical protein